MLSIRLFRIVLIAVAVVALLVASRTAWAAKNIIIMVSDGAGCNTWLAASMYQGKVGRQVYDGSTWTKTLATTYPLNTSKHPTGKNTQQPSLVYTPAKYWDRAPLAVNRKSQPFAGYAFATGEYTDSAAAATALASGAKSYNSALNWTDANAAMQGKTIAELAKASGKSVGVITSVPWSHATPAGLGGAHNVTRNAYTTIANEMLNSSWLDVIMGAGNPGFDDNGQAFAKKPAIKQLAFVGGEKTWEQLVSGTHSGGWKLIQTKSEFEALPHDPNPPKRLVGTAEAANTLQCNRTRSGVRKSAKSSETSGLALGAAGMSQPFDVPLNTNVPSLATMAQGAIHCLENNPNGFYLMIEGGAVDWANHANDGGRMIEEQVDFLAAVNAVVRWVETHGGWSETLLILTADHETGMIWGPQSDKVAFQPIVDNGAGKLPSMMYHSKGHSNSLVPVYARGAGSQRFADRVRGTDQDAAKTWSMSGQYVDNTDIFAVMKDALTPPAKADTQ